MIDYVRSMAENMQDGQNYVVLLIITDGGITGKNNFCLLCFILLSRETTGSPLNMLILVLENTHMKSGIKSLD